MKNQVNPIYMQEQELFQLRATITKIGHSEINKKRYHWIQTDATIFHPKGGGQLSDGGTINGFPVVYVYKETPDRSQIEQFEILHCFLEETLLNLRIGDEVEMIIDQDLRKLYSRVHTAGHLIAATSMELFHILSPSHGNHDPEDAFVKFKISKDMQVNINEMKSRIQSALENRIEESLEVKVTKIPSGLRAIQIGKSVMPCGGTHVKNLKEIGNITIKDIIHNKKDQTLTIKYKC